jgi:hypothetical protein
MPGTSAAAVDRSNLLTSRAAPSPESASPGDRVLLPPLRALLGLVLLQRGLVLLLLLALPHALTAAGSVGWNSVSSFGQGEPQGFQRGGLVLGARAGDLRPAGWAAPLRGEELGDLR